MGLRIEERLAKEDSTLQVVSLTLLGVALQTIMVYPSFGLITVALFVQGLPLQSTPVSPFLIFLYFIITIIYCVGVSLRIRPKRLVSPLYIQILTAVTFTLTFPDYSLIVRGAIFEFQLLDPEIRTLLVLGTFLGIMGFVQTSVVRSLIGLNGTINDVDMQTCEVPADYDKVSVLLTDRVRLESWQLELKEKTTNRVVIMSGGLDPFQKVVVLARNVKSQTMLAVAAYRRRYYSIQKSEAASRQLRGIIKELEDELATKFKPASEENPAATKVMQLALEPTRSRIGDLQKLPRLYQIALVTIAALGMVLTYIFYLNGNVELYVSSIVLVIVAIIADLTPVLRESFKKSASESSL